MAQKGPQTNGDWGQFGLQPFHYEPCPRLDHFTHRGSTDSARNYCKNWTVAQRRTFPPLGDGDTGRASSRERQYARDTADEELAVPLETYVTAAHRDPDLAEELDRADEAAETEADEETPSPVHQRQVLRAHVNLGHPTI